MRLALLTCEQPWQRTLAARLSAHAELALVAVDQHLSASGRVSRIARLLGDPVAFASKLSEKLAVRGFEGRDQRHYAEAFERIGAPPFERSAGQTLFARDINSMEVARQIEALKPDLIVVSGTRLIRRPVLGCASRFGMINLHTGLSPYYRGGPCTFWALYNEEPEYAGATVHILTAGIDSGDIILSGRPQLETTDGLASLDVKVIDLGHRLLLRSLNLIENGRAPQVPNWEKGRLFLQRDFTARVRMGLEAKLRDGLMERCLRRLAAHPPSVRTVDAQ